MMDTESKTSDRDTSQLSEPPSDLDSSDSDSPTQTKQTEWLATTRKRRSTAGNRMKSMLANEEPDSDLELLFAEDENDEGFSGVDDNASDVHMDSSSDDEDDNNANDDDMAGEKELERQAKEKKAAQRKRKAQDAIPAKFRKKVRIDPTTTSSTPAPAPAPAPRPKKKSERASWLPSPADLPTRASSRKTTRISKEQLHQQMAEREVRRLKQLAQMEKKAARLEAMKKPPMTQEQRLAEAAIVEKRNSKSLNRWEEAEKQREEERKAKLAALNQRTLKGPVITFWSGKGQWDDLELRSLRPFVTEVEEKPKKKREKVDKGAAKEKGKGKQKDKENETPVEKEKGKETDKDQADGAVKVSDQGLENPKTIETIETEKPATGVKVDNDKAITAEDIITPEPSISDTNPTKTSELPVYAEPAVPVAETASTEPEALLTAELSGESKEVKTEASEDIDTSAPNTVAIVEVSTKVTEASAAETVEEKETLASLTTSQPPASTSTSTSASAPASATVPSYPPSGLAAPAPPPPITSPLAAPAGLSRPPEARPSSVLAAPMLAPPPGINMNGSMPVDGPKSNVLALPNTLQSTLTPPSIRPPESLPLAETSEPSAIIPMDVDTKPTPVEANLQPTQQGTAHTSKSGSPRESEAPPVPEPPRDMNATRNGIIYQNFDGNAIRDKNIQTQILFGRKMTKLASKSNSVPSIHNYGEYQLTNSKEPSPSPICVITNNPARYRDPKTSLPFYNMHAYKEIQRLNSGDYQWSRILGAWVGSTKQAARGVPDRFLNPDSKKPNAPTATEGDKVEREDQSGKKNEDNATQHAASTNEAAVKTEAPEAPEVPEQSVQPMQPVAAAQ